MRKFNLRECLSSAVYLRLFQTSRLHGIYCSTRWSKARIIDALHEFFSNEDNLVFLLKGLNDEAFRAIRILAANEFCLAAPVFLEEFGDIPSAVSPSFADEMNSRVPSCVTEELYRSGIIYAVDENSKKKGRQWIVIPSEFHKAITNMNEEWVKSVSGQMEIKPEELLHNMAVFAAYISCGNIRPLNEFWLPPSHIKGLVSRLLILPGYGLKFDDSLDRNSLPGSERKIPYIIFLHWLMKYCGFIDTSADKLALTQFGWTWLKMGFAARLDTVIRIILNRDVAEEIIDENGDVSAISDQDFRKRAAYLEDKFQQPFMRHRDPVHIRMLIMEKLSELSSRKRTEFNFLADVITHHLLKYINSKKRDLMEEVKRFLIGPLFWLGMVRTEMIESREFPESISLTNISGHYLRNDRLKTGRFPNETNCKMGKNNIFSVMKGSPPYFLSQGVQFGDWLERDQQTLTERIKIKKSSLIISSAKGWDYNQTINFFESALGKMPTKRFTAIIKRSFRRGPDLNIKLSLIASSKNRKIMKSIGEQRVLDKYIKRQLSPNTVELNVEKLDSFLKALEREGYTAINHATFEKKNKKKSLPDVSMLLTALLVYERVGELIRRDFTAGQILTNDLKSRLNRLQAIAAEQHADAVIEKLKSVIDGYAPFGVFENTADKDEIKRSIEKAAELNRSVKIDYYTAGRNQMTQRRITPYHISKRKGVDYVHGYCHSRLDERIFRLDRIRKVY